MQRYTSCILSLEKAENINRRNRDDVDYYLASEADAEIAKLKEALSGVAIMLNTALKDYDDEPWAKRVREALATRSL